MPVLLWIGRAGNEIWDGAAAWCTFIPPSRAHLTLRNLTPMPLALSPSTRTLGQVCFSPSDDTILVSGEEANVCQLTTSDGAFHSVLAIESIGDDEGNYTKSYYTADSRSTLGPTTRNKIRIVPTKN